MSENFERACVIVGGSEINEYETIKSLLNEKDFFIFCDSGLDHMEHLGIKPDLVVGDFDSHEKPDFHVETIVLPSEKDDTDTVFAIKEGIRRSYRKFYMVGVTGRRFDHTMANVSALIMLEKAGCKGKIYDDYGEMEIISREKAFISDAFSYFSLLNIDGSAKGVTIENAKFPLKDAEINCDYQYGVSNEVLKGKRAEVSLREGRLLLVKIR